MNQKIINRLLIVVFAAFVTCMPAGCAGITGNSAGKAKDPAVETAYISEVFPLEREGIDLHLECMKLAL